MDAQVRIYYPSAPDESQEGIRVKCCCPEAVKIAAMISGRALRDGRSRLAQTLQADEVHEDCRSSADSVLSAVLLCCFLFCLWVFCVHSFVVCFDHLEFNELCSCD